MLRNTDSPKTRAAKYTRFAATLAAAVALTLITASHSVANSSCGGLNQRVCKKWEQLRGCDPGLHRTSPIGGICTYDNKFIPNPIEKIISPAPVPQPETPRAEAPPITTPGYPAPVQTGKKGALPHISQVPPTQPTAMDGLWKLTANNIPYKIEAGRLIAMAEYMHLFVFPVDAHDVVVKDIVQTGPGQLSGQDLALIGPWTGRLQQDGTIAIQVQGAMGPFSSTLTPIQLSSPEWFAQEMASLSGGYQPPGVMPPPVLPGPPTPYPHPPAPVPPGLDGDSLYPPGWGN